MKKFTYILLLAFLLSLTLYGCNQKESIDFQENVEDIEIEELQADTRTIIPYSELPTYEYTEEEILLDNNSETIYGLLFIPVKNEETFPLIILSHGLGASYRSELEYAKEFASHGIAAFCFDFRGGGGSMSDGETTEMSVMTEVSDLTVVLDNAQNWEHINKEKIILFGESQGGMVSAIVAARNNKTIDGLILLYPGFVISDVVNTMFDSVEDIPETYDFYWITLGKQYVLDLKDYDVYEEIGDFKKDVLILHGTEDEIVASSYSEKADRIYDNSKLIFIEGAKHGFEGDYFYQSLEPIFIYLQEIDVIKNENV